MAEAGSIPDGTKTFVIVLTILLGCLLSRAGAFELSVSNGLYSLDATNANLAEILAEIDRREPASLRFSGDQDRPVSLKLRRVSLNRLLDGLGVSYVLTYESDAGGAYELSEARTLGSGEKGVDSSAASRIRRLIGNLRDDHIRGNAMHAQNDLMELGCATVPFLDEALHDDDFQTRQSAASVLHMLCPEHRASDRMIEVCFELLNVEALDYDEAYLMNAASAFHLLESSNVYPRVRSRILNNLQSADPRERFYSALMAAQHRETAHASALARILIPHLADNDLPNDAGAAAHALYNLGPAARPHLLPYLDSPDIQQAELVTHVVDALDLGPPDTFNGFMYASYAKVPAVSRPMIYVLEWPRDGFPDEGGRYRDLQEPRQTSAELYGTAPRGE